MRIAPTGAAIAVAVLAGNLAAPVLAGSRASDTTPEISSNWAGYVVTQRTNGPTSFTSVTAAWEQPKARCTGGSAGTRSSFWVGLGGYHYSSPRIEQIGSASECSDSNKQHYYAWYDFPPNVGVVLKLKVHAGDHVTARVDMNASKTSVRLQFTDTTTGQTYAKRFPTAAPDLSSAEWIAEAPQSCHDSVCQSVPLADFGSVSMTKVAAVANGHHGTITDNHWASTAMELVPRATQHYGFYSGSSTTSSTAGAVPKALATDGSSFSVIWKANTTKPPAKTSPGAYVA